MSDRDRDDVDLEQQRREVAVGAVLAVVGLVVIPVAVMGTEVYLTFVLAPLEALAAGLLEVAPLVIAGGLAVLLLWLVRVDGRADS